MAALYEDDDQFWTDDDEDEEDKEDENQDGGDGEQPVDQRDQPSHQEDSDPQEAAAAAAAPPPGPLDGPAAAAAAAAAVPKPKRIRKKWVVEESTDVSDFDALLPPSERALDYPFELDTFQKRAILRIHQSQPVFVAAHTSAGKTAVAEYAISMAHNAGRRAIYTSPIKALSNQKYRDFNAKFPSVGIITGDVSINQEASCLIMTTEILRTMLYRGDDTIQDLSVVVFDEAHYVSDAERGVVWEEVIILLPSHINLLFLSATCPNFLDFGDWIGRTKKRTVYAVYTKMRPTPLRHYLYVQGKPFLLMDNKFRSDAFLQAHQHMRSLKEKDTAASKASAKGKAKAKPKVVRASNYVAGVKTDTHRLQALLKELEKEQKLPVVVFAFSRRKCESYACGMPNLDLLDSTRKSEIHVFVQESLKNLSDADRGLKQIQATVELLGRGLGVHHGGLLPIVKEMVEILFARGLVRVLFATETFAMGVNMPARSVVFASLKKHDGSRLRILKSSEYTQMAGRAGRRGLDEYGSVFIFCDPQEMPDQKEVTTMMMAQATPLRSKFKVSYSMLLQLAKSPLLSVQDMISQSYSESDRSRKLPIYRRDIKRRQQELESMQPIQCLLGEPTIDEYVKASSQFEGVTRNLHRKLFTSKASTDVFCPGRICMFSSLSAYLGVSSPCYGALLSLDFKPLSQKHDPEFEAIVLLPEGPEWPPPAGGGGDAAKGKGGGEDGERVKVVGEGRLVSVGVVEVGNDEHEQFSRWVHCKYIPLRKVSKVTELVVSAAVTSDDEDADVSMARLGQEVARTCTDHDSPARDGLPALQISKQFKEIENEFYENILKQRDLSRALAANKCHRCKLKEPHFQQASRRDQVVRDIEEYSFSLNDESLYLLPLLQSKMAVLRKLGYIEEDQTLTLKGRFACEVVTSDELTLVEVIMSGIATNLEPAEVVSILSSFIFMEKCEDEPEDPTDNMRHAKQAVADWHRTVDAAQKECRVQMEDPVTVNFGLTQVVYEWAVGKTFAEIMTCTTVQEGSIVRAILRLNELCKKMKAAAERLLGDTALAEKLEQAESFLCRPPVSIPSLYLT